MRYSAAQMQLDTRKQCTHAVWDFYPRSQVPPAQMHATGYLLQLINTKYAHKKTSLPSLIFCVRLLAHVYIPYSRLFFEGKISAN